MSVSYPARYLDEAGEELTTIENDGRMLRLVVRGIEFAGLSFDTLAPVGQVDDVQLASFCFFLDSLCGFELDCDIPVQVDNAGCVDWANLQVHLELGRPDESRRIGVIRIKEDGAVVEDGRALNGEVLRLELRWADTTYRSGGRNLHSSFDEQLTELMANLPGNLWPRICWTCAYSDFHWSGSGMFGQLACFRNTKVEYLRARTREDLRALWERRAEDVQEIYACGEYERRKSGSGLYVGAEYSGKRA